MHTETNYQQADILAMLILQRTFPNNWNRKYVHGKFESQYSKDLQYVTCKLFREDMMQK